MKYDPFVSMNLSYFYVAAPWRDHPDIEQWCLDLDSPGIFSFGGTGVYFTRSEDAMLFKLRWA